ncbi:SbcC/MukB-like Walker B domain-containing protein, partial [Sphaerisporangium aureirubrum]
LEARRGDEERWGEVEGALAELEERLSGVARREGELARARDALPARVAELEERLVAVRGDAARVPGARVVRDAAVLQAEHVVRRDALEGELAEAEEERRAAIDEAQEARDRFQAVRQARMDGMAAELARALAPGEPCTVCGSAEHPAPAELEDAGPTAEDEHEAQARGEAAQEARQVAEGRVAGLASLLEEAAAQAGGLTVAETLAACQEAEAELARLGASAEQESRLVAEIAQVRAELEDAMGGARELALEAAQGRAAEVVLREERERLTRALDAARGEDPSVTARWSRRTEEFRLLQAAAEAAARAVEAETAHHQARAAARLALTRPRLTAGWDLPWHSTANPLGRDAESDASQGGEGVEEPSEEGTAEVLAEAERVLGWAEAEAGEEEGLVEEWGRVEGELAEAGEVVVRVGVEIAGEKARREGLLGEAERLAGVLDGARGQDASLTARIERLGHEVESLRDAAEAGRAAESARGEADEAWARADRAAVEAGFSGVADARAAPRTAASLEEMTERLRALDAERVAVGKALSDPVLVAAAGLPEPDLGALEAAHDEAERAHAARASARDQAAARHGQLVGLAATLDVTLADWRPAEERHLLAKRLAELAGGTSPDNTEHTRLSSYVLGERLRQVVDAANHRLEHMSGGRYLLLYDKRKSAADRKRAGGGLGLRVLDGWTGTDRDPATLSGGEAFMTSLALALALADVVTAEAGGVELGTLFIDEGFGTLDEDTLDAVLDILDDLRDGGRAVGIVSHVAELRSRVPAQLRVQKHRHGSTLSVAVPG